MAQSSNYKGYNRQVRALTEETSFSGGMMWTGKNVDETLMIPQVFVKQEIPLNRYMLGIARCSSLKSLNPTWVKNLLIL